MIRKRLEIGFWAHFRQWGSQPQSRILGLALLLGSLVFSCPGCSSSSQFDVISLSYTDSYGLANSKIDFSSPPDTSWSLESLYTHIVRFNTDFSSDDFSIVDSFPRSGRFTVCDTAGALVTQYCLDDCCVVEVRRFAPSYTVDTVFYSCEESYYEKLSQISEMSYSIPESLLAIEEFRVRQGSGTRCVQLLRVYGTGEADTVADFVGARGTRFSMNGKQFLTNKLPDSPSSEWEILRNSSEMEKLDSIVLHWPPKPDDTTQHTTVLVYDIATGQITMPLSGGADCTDPYRLTIGQPLFYRRAERSQNHHDVWCYDETYGEVQLTHLADNEQLWGYFVRRDSLHYRVVREDKDTAYVVTIPLQVPQPSD